MFIFWKAGFVEIANRFIVHEQFKIIPSVVHNLLSIAEVLI